jgi:hypothetical protein
MLFDALVALFVYVWPMVGLVTVLFGSVLSWVFLSEFIEFIEFIELFELLSLWSLFY